MALSSIWCATNLSGGKEAGERIILDASKIETAYGNDVLINQAEPI
jgi:hypothetical protein